MAAAAEPPAVRRIQGVSDLNPVAPQQLSTESRKLFEVLNGEDDLPCVVLAAAFLDSVLASLLFAHLKDPAVARSLLAPDGPLGTYGARTDIAYSLGLIKKSHYHDLKIIGRIRNRFAHSHLALSFDEPPLQQLCGELKECRILSLVLPEDAVVSSRTPTPDERRRGARGQFNLTVALVANWLLLAALAEDKGPAGTPRPESKAPSKRFERTQ